MSPDAFGDQFKRETLLQWLCIAAEQTNNLPSWPRNVCNLEVCEGLDLSELSEQLSVMAGFKCISNCQNRVL